MTDADRLDMQLRIILSGVVLVDRRGEEWTITKFAADGSALMSRPGLSQAVPVKRLDGFRRKDG